MKILIIDDNIAIQEIIAEILTVDGYEIDRASSIEEAIAKIDSFRPDAIILDSQVGGESGLTVLDSLEAGSDVKAIILTTGKEQIPKDNPFIYGYIQKPFKSTDILDKVRSIASESEAKHVREKKSKFRLFSKPSPDDKQEEDVSDVRFGKSYVVFEDEPELVYKVASSFLSKGCNLLIVTSGRSKTVTDRFKDDHVTILGLSSKPRIGYVEMSKLGTLMGEITKYVSKNNMPVVVIDDLGKLISVNGLNTILTMLYQIINGGSKIATSMVVSTSDESLTDKDKELFLHDMELYKA
jgi:CheY-like chemotaxis protein